MFYDNYLKVCEAKGVSPTRVLKDLKISKSSYSHWKSGGEPLNETKKKIADYFEITVSDLTAGEIAQQEEKPDVIKDTELSEDEKRLLDIIRQLPPEKQDLVEQLAINMRNTK